MTGIGNAIATCLATGVAAVRRGAWACALPLALGVLIALGGGSAAAAGSCPNEKLREESSLIPGKAVHYSQELPECRAYEMVSPLEKGSHDADIGGETGSIALPLWVAPSGEALIWHGEGAFAGAENFLASTTPENPYLSRRTVSGWETSAFAPSRSLVNVPFFNGFLGDSSPDLRTVDVACGQQPTGSGEFVNASVACAERRGEGSWVKGPLYTNLSDLPINHMSTSYFGMGWSSPTLRAFVSVNVALLPEDVVTKIPTEGKTNSIYEIAGLGSGSETLRLANLDNEGHVLLASGDVFGGVGAPSLGSFELTTYTGSEAVSSASAGSDQRAISQSGETVFFTATPNPVRTEEQTLAVYARVPCEFAALPCDTKSDEQSAEGVVEGRQTVKVSDPGPAEGCEECKTHVTGSLEESAIYQGASADGSKVFFTTTHQLLGSEELTPTPNLYEYDFNGPEGHKVVKLSETTAAEGAQVEGVAAVSPDGSHVYFLARGALPETEPNTTADAEGNVVHESPVAGADNLYVYDSDAQAEGKKPLKLVVGGSLTRELGELVQPEGRRAQTTPDGRFLVFSAPVALAGDLNTKGCPSKCPSAVYRYDTQTGELTWVSHGAEGQTSYQGEPARVGGCSVPCNLTSDATAAREDVGRAISDDGQQIIFLTPEKLQAGDINNSGDVYLWHEGAVHMISDGRDPQGLGNRNSSNPTGEPVATISASGSDIFFPTRTALLPHDTDDLVDVYDARIDGGFPEQVPSSCPPEAAGGCQGTPPPPPSATAAPTSFFAAGGNLPAPLASSLAFKTTSKPPTRAQKLARALKACRKQHKRKPRMACERRANRTYGAKKKAK